MITFCILIKNNEKTIFRCIKSIPKNSKVLVLDTGCEDDTINIINSLKDDYNIEIYKYNWTNDFSDARNHAIMHVKTKFLFFLDSDEEIIKIDINSIILKMNTVNFSGFSNIKSYISEHESRIEVGRERVFYRNNVKYRYKIHEVGWPLEEENKSADLNAHLELVHYGYNDSYVNLNEKYLRNVSLIEEMKNEEPDNLLWNYYYLRENVAIIIENNNVEQGKEVLKTNTEILKNHLNVTSKDKIHLNVVNAMLIELINLSIGIDVEYINVLYYEFYASRTLTITSIDQIQKMKVFIEQTRLLKYSNLLEKAANLLDFLEEDSLDQFGSSVEDLEIVASDLYEKILEIR